VTDPAVLPPNLQARYGVAPRSRTRQVITWTVILLVAIAATAWLNQANNPVATGRIITFTTQPDHATIRFETSRPSGHPSSCVLRAQDTASTDIGYATVQVPAGAATVQQTYQLRTLGTANVVELLGCGVDGKPAKVAAPAFAPGIQPPAQPWTP